MPEPPPQPPSPDLHDNHFGPIRRPLLKRRLLLAVLLALLIAGIFFGIHLYHRLMAYESTDDAFLEGHVIPISPRVAGHVARVAVDDNQAVREGDLLVQIDPADFRTRLDQGTAALAAARSQEKQAKIAVELTSVTSTAGVSQATFGVQQGGSTVSATLAQLAGAAGQVLQAEAALNVAQAGLRQAEADVEEQRAVVTRSQKDQVRVDELANEGVVSQQARDLADTTAMQESAKLVSQQKKVDAAQAQLKQADAMLKSAQEARHAAQAQVGAAQAAQGQASGKLAEANVTPQRVEASQSALEGAAADVRRLEAAMHQAELDLSYTAIKAPVAGHVTRKSVEPGAYVQVGQPLLALVPHEIWVVANFKETQLTTMRPGQPVEIKVDTYPGRTFKGKVDSIQRGTGARFSLFPPENATGNYIKVVQRVPVKIVFVEDLAHAPLLAPGMSVTPRVKVR